MAATGALKDRIQLLQAAVARGQATGKALKPEIQQELDSYRSQGLLGSNTGGASGSGAKPTEAQAKAVGFLTRALGANEQFEGAVTLPDGKKMAVAPRGVIAQGIVDALPEGIANGLTSDDRQVSENAQRDFITATLRQESGAAISAGEYDNQRKTFFPQPNDGEKVIAAKAAARRRALDGLIAAAGPVVGDDLRKKYAGYFPQEAKGGDQTSGAVGVVADGSGAPPTGPTGGGGPGGGQVAFNDDLPAQNANALKLAPEQTAAMQALVQSGASSDAIIALGRTFGANITPENAAALEKFYSDPKNRSVAPTVNVDNSVKPVDAGDGTLGAAARGAGSILTAGFLDEAGALADTVTKGGTYGDNLNTRRGQELYDEQNHFWGRLAGQLVGGAVLPSGVVEAGTGAALNAARTGVGRVAATAAGARAAALQAVAEGAGYGGAYGFGSANGDLADRAIGGASGAAVGGLTGGVLTYGGARAANALTQRARVATGGLTDGQEVLAAAERQGITPFPADVGGGAVRRATSATAQTIGGASPIIAGARRTIDSAEAVRNRVAASIGAPVNPEAAGETARAGAQAFIARTSTRGNALYRAAEQSAGQAQVETPEALRVLNQELPALEEAAVPNPALPILQGLRDGLQTPSTVRGLRNTRTAIRSAFEGAGLRGSNEERIANRVVDAAADDITNGLRAQGLDTAARQYRVADRYWRERLQTIDDHLEPILGNANNPKSGEQIVQGLKSAMAGNNRRFVGFVNALPPQEQATVRASLIQRMGAATKGNQDQTGEVFSLGTFLTNWNDIGQRARDTLFGPEGRAALNDLARYAAGSKEAQRFANHSNTGGVAGNLATMASGAAGIATLGKFLALQYGAGRLLASPRFARWLARTPANPNASAGAAYIRRLSVIAKAEPAIANEVIQLQQRLAEAFTSAPTRLAADERRDSGAPVQGQAGNQNSPADGTQP